MVSVFETVNIMLLANPTASQYICNVYIYIAPNEKIYFNVLKINFVHNADIFRSVHFLLFGDILFRIHAMILS